MNCLPLLNPNGCLLLEVAVRLIEARKTKSIWAKRAEVEQTVDTLEGSLITGPDDYLCRGIAGEYWPQKFPRILEKYTPTKFFDAEGWQQFDPKPEATPVLAVQMDAPFRIRSEWGELRGKAKDYVVRSMADTNDVWIVNKSIFEASYEMGKANR